MGVSYSALLGLGAVGAEYREPLGLICDFLVGRDGGPEIPLLLPQVTQGVVQGGNLPSYLPSLIGSHPENHTLLPQVIHCIVQ